jgi:PTH1 family peptidyl-tRNA hydrolase
LKIVLGLGNPGARYARTRHNLGFLVVDELARRAHVELARRDAVSEAARIAEVEIGGEPVVLAEPRTYMNRSGRAAGDLLRRYRGEAADLLVVHDDADLTLGRIRLRPGGGAGGHNGIRSVMTALGTGDFPRVKLGVKGDGREAADLADYVLEEFTPDESAAVRDLVAIGSDAVEAVVTAGIEAAMNRFNPKGT